jgi:hypothetical protein
MGDEPARGAARRKVHGRRRGKALKPSQRRHLATLLPRLLVPGVRPVLRLTARRSGGRSISRRSFPARARSGSRSASAAASTCTASRARTRMSG